MDEGNAEGFDGTEREFAAARSRDVSAAPGGVRYGLTAGDMGLVQKKHIEFTNWKITVSWANAKGGKTTGRDEAVWVMTERLRNALEARRFLKDDDYVFGTEDGRRVKKFHKSWRQLFKAAGLPPELVWHDARHEFVSSLIEVGGTIQETKELARHKSISTTAKYMKGPRGAAESAAGEAGEQGKHRWIDRI